MESTSHSCPRVTRGATARSVSRSKKLAMHHKQKFRSRRSSYTVITLCTTSRPLSSFSVSCIGIVGYQQHMKSFRNRGQPFRKGQKRYGGLSSTGDCGSGCRLAMLCSSESQYWLRQSSHSSRDRTFDYACPMVHLPSV